MKEMNEMECIEMDEICYIPTCIYTCEKGINFFTCFDQSRGVCSII